MKNAMQKRILMLLEYLYTKTDEQHPATIIDLLNHLAAAGIKSERRSVYSDIAILDELGVDVICLKSRQNQYYIGARHFQLPELKLLVDAIQSSRFVTPKKSAELIVIDEKDEGEILERTIWASLESVFPLKLYRSPQVKIGEKTRELTDVFSFYTYGCFFIEAKDLSVINAGYGRDSMRRTAGVQKQVKKAIKQLIGASKAFQHGETIFDVEGHELDIDRNQPPHCIVLITELMHYGDWKDIEIELVEAMQQTGAFFHLLDLRELIALLKGSSGKSELLDYNLMKRCKLFLETQSVFIRSQPPSVPHV